MRPSQQTKMEVVSSARGIDSHKPSMPQIRDRKMIPSTVKRKVREKEIAAEIFPFPSAVKNPEPKILIPAKRKPIANRRKP